jgi:hypothetical protein
LGLGKRTGLIGRGLGRRGDLLGFGLAEGDVTGGVDLDLLRLGLLTEDSWSARAWAIFASRVTGASF